MGQKVIYTNDVIYTAIVHCSFGVGVIINAKKTDVFFPDVPVGYPPPSSSEPPFTVMMSFSTTQ